MGMLSNDSADTATLSDDPGESEADKRWWLVVAHHPDPTRIGQRTEVQPGRALELGRGADVLGVGTLDDDRISRAHASIAWSSSEAPSVSDLGSHNGTFVDGARIESGTLSADSVLGIGRLLLLVAHEPVSEDTGSADCFPQPCGPTWRRLHATLSRVASRSTPVLLWGETGVGKDTLARWIHDRGDQGGDFHRLAMHNFNDLPADTRGTVYLDGLEDAPEPAQRLLMQWIEANSPPQRVRFIASSRVDLARLVRRGGVRPELAHRLGRWTFWVPPVRKRRCDIGPMALAFARRYGGDDISLHPELVFRLLRHAWPGNVRELEAIVERAVVEAEGDPLIRPFAELGALLSQPRSTAQISTFGRSRGRHPFVLHTTGTWFCEPGKDTYDLSRRKLLVRLLSALIDRRRTEPGSPLSVDALLARGWPDERFIAKTGANRVYVALTTLRKLGLRDLLVRDEGGYYLDPDVPTRFEQADP